MSERRDPSTPDDQTRERLNSVVAAQIEATLESCDEQKPEVNDGFDAAQPQSKATDTATVLMPDRTAPNGTDGGDVDEAKRGTTN